jgi:integrase/recombinase XerD
MNLNKGGNMNLQNGARPHQTLLDEYVDYLRSERRLTEPTVKAHRDHIAAMLEDVRCSPTELSLQMSHSYVLAFFTQRAQGRRLTMRRQLQGVLRLFLRFCFQKGHLDRDLSVAIPCIRSYKLSVTPRGISEPDALKTMECIDRTTPKGRRDFAIIQVLYYYGVRGGQVRALQLADIHWRENRIRFPSSKGGKELVAPLTEQVGNSLLDYLRHGRPPTSYSQVFLTVQLPIRPLKSPAVISEMVHQRLSQAGVINPHKGSHIFRHAFAMRMLQRGQSLKTIADLLGHRNINTTFIYTKVDMEALRQAILEWPEV